MAAFQISREFPGNRARFYSSVTEFPATIIPVPETGERRKTTTKNLYRWEIRHEEALSGNLARCLITARVESTRYIWRAHRVAVGPTPLGHEISLWDSLGFARTLKDWTPARIYTLPKETAGSLPLSPSREAPALRTSEPLPGFLARCHLCGIVKLWLPLATASRALVLRVHRQYDTLLVFYFLWHGFKLTGIPSLLLNVNCMHACMHFKYLSCYLEIG